MSYNRDQIEFLVAFLEDEQRWITAKELKKLTMVNKKTLRAIASASGERIITGQMGYKAAKCSTPQEILNSSNWLEHQGNIMCFRAQAIRKRYFFKLIKLKKLKHSYESVS